MHSNGSFLMRTFFYCAAVLLYVFSASNCFAEEPVQGERAFSILQQTTPRLQRELSRAGFKEGAPLFVRIFKLEGELEVWLFSEQKYKLFKKYYICSYAGYPGPKLREGDWQSPEGFYVVDESLMHPDSNYHLAFNIGYPNSLDVTLGRTGSAIMVHGNCSSSGCFAMTDKRIEEIYTLAHLAFKNGQPSFGVHIFPFRMTAANMEKFKCSPWFSFWQNLAEGYDYFEKNRLVPQISVAENKYVIDNPVRLVLRKSEDEIKRIQ